MIGPSVLRIFMFSRRRLRAQHRGIIRTTASVLMERQPRVEGEPLVHYHFHALKFWEEDAIVPLERRLFVE